MKRRHRVEKLRAEVEALRKKLSLYEKRQERKASKTRSGSGE